jgi:NAD(P)-dependent dehydrogenase (short-subunit alcohol dehydrogenase family)
MAHTLSPSSDPCHTSARLRRVVSHRCPGTHLCCWLITMPPARCNPCNPCNVAAVVAAVTETYAHGVVAFHVLPWRSANSQQPSSKPPPVQVSRVPPVTSTVVAHVCVSGGDRPVEWTPSAAYKKMFAVNVIGMAMVTKSVLPLIRKAGDASHVGVDDHCRWLPKPALKSLPTLSFPCSCAQFRNRDLTSPIRT